MSLSEDFDVEALAAPLDAGAGADPRTSPDAAAFFRMKDLRAEARTAERTAAATPEGDTPLIEAGQRLWSELSELACDLLAHRGKDLEVACWLCEAQVRLRGFAGLCDGLELIGRLLDYWDEGLHPAEDEDGPLGRVAPIGGLLGLDGTAALVQPIRVLPLTDKAPTVALWRVETAFAPLPSGDDAAARERQQARRAEQVEEVTQALARASTDFLRATHRDAGLAADAVERLAALVDARTGVGRFGSQVVAPLHAVVTVLEQNAGARLADPVVDAPPAEEGAAEPTSQGEPRSVRTRAEAYEAILAIADFFAETEPQSLVARSLREVVRRAKLPLEDLLTELIPAPDQRSLFLQRAGVRDEAAQANASSTY
ncbi:MAG: type VI secretion system protein TssA [Caulobacteraceae bacterium]|nr:type VI secretion system protein TssA [Caulobacter sp.]